MEQLQADMEQLQADMEQLQADMEQLQADMEQLQADMEQLQADMEQLQADMEQLQAAVCRGWRHAGEAVAEVAECQQRRAPAWARELCKHLQDSDLLLRITVVAVVGQTYLMPELLWASKDDGLHAFELYRHIQQVCKGLQQPWANNAQLLSQLHSKLQHPVPIDQQEQQKQQLATYLQQHCAAMEDYYRQHCKRQLDMPHLMAALGGSDPQSCREVAAKVVQCAALRMDEGQSDLGVWDPHCTWRQFQQDIQAMAEGVLSGMSHLQCP
ncbi:hypothetical protein V8C86DRAFT_2842811, partial [Haematococcus lacustris]